MTEEKTYNWFIAVAVDFKAGSKIYALAPTADEAMFAGNENAGGQILTVIPASDQLGLYLGQEKGTYGYEGVNWLILDEIAQLDPEMRGGQDGEVPPGEE